jgi:hypothetical protein
LDLDGGAENKPRKAYVILSDGDEGQGLEQVRFQVNSSFAMLEQKKAGSEGVGPEALGNPGRFGLAVFEIKSAPASLPELPSLGPWT